MKTKFEFEPSKTIREFKCSSLVGKPVNILCEHFDNETFGTDSKDKKPATNQFVRIERCPKADVHLFASGWAGKVLGKKNEKIKRVIRKVTLIESMNGGRGDWEEYSSYADFFNNQRKKRVIASWSGGIFGRFGGSGGDPDRADIRFYFDDFMIEDFRFDFTAPEEWYSELYLKQADIDRERCYANAKEAVEAFSAKCRDDMFGERYFPVLAFPASTPRDVVMSVANGAKSSTKPIVGKDWIVMGARCKPHQFAEVIEATYVSGGAIPKDREWDWS
jgi:hypothetical protein